VRGQHPSQEHLEKLELHERLRLDPPRASTARARPRRAERATRHQIQTMNTRINNTEPRLQTVRSRRLLRNLIAGAVLNRSFLTALDLPSRQNTLHTRLSASNCSKMQLVLQHPKINNTESPRLLRKLTLQRTRTSKQPHKSPSATSICLYERHTVLRPAATCR